jgi:hypothetical protein
MSKPRGQKAPRRFSVISGFELPATSQQSALVWWLFGYCQRREMKTARFTVRIAAGIVVFACFVVVSAVLPVKAAMPCPSDTSKSIERAREALRTDNPAGDRAALACLVEAVAAIDARLTGLSNGSIPFDGTAYLPKGFVITKTPSSEGR